MLQFYNPQLFSALFFVIVLGFCCSYRCERISLEGMAGAAEAPKAREGPDADVERLRGFRCLKQIRKLLARLREHRGKPDRPRRTELRSSVGKDDLPGQGEPYSVIPSLRKASVTTGWFGRSRLAWRQ